MLTENDVSVAVRCYLYSFEYAKATDLFTVYDAKGRKIVTAPLQPLIRVAGVDGQDRGVVQGRLQSATRAGATILFQYSGVNQTGSLKLLARFDEHGFWFDPPEYANSVETDIVSLHYFAESNAGTIHPSLHSTYLTLPGIAEAPSVSAIQPASGNLEQTISLGRSGFYVPPFTHQQWGLPVHYFCVTGTDTQSIDGGRRDTYTRFRSETLLCGLADLPNGDLMFDLRTGGHCSLWVDYRSDLWHHLRTPGAVRLGCTLAFVFAPDPRSAAIAFGEQLVRSNLIQRKVNSTYKNSIALAPEFCTWGPQVERNFVKAHLNEDFLRSLYAELKTSGMKASIFSIDDKWEGRYGNLQHDPGRFPNFVALLDSIRAEGHHIGLWTAFMRCEDPSDLGLELKHMLQTADGHPYMGGHREYYILDFTQPEVEKVLTERASNFMRIYKPALVKFDFGYELPAMRSAAAADKRLCGERLLQRGLDIVLNALRAVNPDVVVMYYQLSPLFTKYFDLHSTDDLYLAAGDYSLEANRRIYYASALTPLGILVYGSSGYDWSSSPSIWFDSVAAGTIGSLNDFQGDEFGETSSPGAIALYNGFCKAIRQENIFEVIVYPPPRLEASIAGGHARSWARVSAGKVTLLAQRPASFDDSDTLDHRPTDARVAGLLETSAAVVVASMDADSVTTTSRLIVVPCDTGHMRLKRIRGTNARVTTHLFDGTSTATVVALQEHILSLDLVRLSTHGVPIEYLEIEIS
ncbi:MAG: TIM-barrel domain-containing protein [Acidobacteriota bacterium]